MRNRRIALFIGLFVVLLSMYVMAQAAHYGEAEEGSKDYRKLFIAPLSIREDTVVQTGDVSIIYSASPDYSARPVVDHLTLEIVSAKGVALNSFTIANPRILRIADFGDEESGIVEAESIEETLRVPFYKEAKSIKIYAPDGALLGEVGVADAIAGFCDVHWNDVDCNDLDQGFLDSLGLKTNSMFDYFSGLS